MGGRSTSQTAVLRERKLDSSSNFDLRSWQGLTEVLRAGKESIRNPESYSDFRNLILQYAQNGGDSELRKKIDTIVSSFTMQTSSPTVTPEATDTVTNAPKKDIRVISEDTEPHPRTAQGIGLRRMQPRFSHTQQSNSIHTIEKPQTKESMQSVSVPDTVTHTEVSDVPVPKKSVTQPDHEVVTPQSEVQSIPAVPSQESREKHFKSIEEYKLRIAEIKRSVNAHVGNPAMLIDTHNELGKRYMNALLTALKVTGGGSTEDVDSAMNQLEELAAAILSDAPSGDAYPPKEDIVADPVPETSDVVNIDNQRTTTAPDIKPEPISSSDAVVPQDDRAPFTKENSKAVEIELPPVQGMKAPQGDTKHDFDMKPIHKYSAKSMLDSFLAGEGTAPQRRDTLPSLSTQTSEQNADAQVAEEATVIAPLGRVTQTVKSFSDIRSKIPSQEQESQSRITQQPQAPVQQSELFTQQITRMLDQLLHEWSIFSGSGLFGMGPGGSEHPLYITLSTLSMGEVIAGRWEKADPKITKIIKQYVDAWRHEQGIAYTANETFEHYLRRVVQRILKRQS